MSVGEVSTPTDALDAMLEDPEIRQSLAVIVANAPTLAALASMGSGLLQRGPDIMDNINASILQLRESDGGNAGGQILPAVRALAELAPLAETLATRVDTVRTLLDSTILDPEVVDVIGSVGQAALAADRATRGKRSSVGGLLALNRQLKDPEVQSALSFLIEFARAFGAGQSSTR